MRDESAFIFSIDRKQIYRVLDAHMAIFRRFDLGPSFRESALGIRGDPLNTEDAGLCFTNGHSHGAFYGIKSDAEGSHEVTGEGQK
jgi:hypothetical protein